MNEEYFMKEAIKESEKAASKGNWAVGCVIVLNNKIISRSPTTKHQNKDRFEHAEINAIRKVSKIISENPNKCEIYVSYEPCPMCFSTIVIGKFKKLIYGMTCEKTGATNLLKHMPKNYKKKDFDIEIKGEFLGDLCREVFKKGYQEST